MFCMFLGKIPRILGCQVMQSDQSADEIECRNHVRAETIIQNFYIIFSIKCDTIALKEA